MLTINIRIRHNCLLHSTTLTTLFQRQGASIRSLYITRFVQMNKTLLTALNGSGFITTLHITGIGRRPDYYLPTTLIAKNMFTLKRLNLGNDVSLAQAHAIHRNIQSASRVGINDFANHMRWALENWGRSSRVLLGLDSLRLTGMEFDKIAIGAMGVSIRWQFLSNLALESCSGVQEAFMTMRNMNSTQGSTSHTLRLNRFTLRQENATPAFNEHLHDFLVAFSDLKQLDVLLEGPSHMQRVHIHAILQSHGTTLRLLLWDQRKESRSSVPTDPSLCMPQATFLDLVVADCPVLEQLGLNVGWEKIMSSKESHLLVCGFFPLQVPNSCIKLRHDR